MVPGLQSFVFPYVFINTVFSLSYQNKLSMSFVLLTDRCADGICQVNFISNSCAIIFYSLFSPFGFFYAQRNTSAKLCHQNTAFLLLLLCNLTYRNQCMEWQFCPRYFHCFQLCDFHSSPFLRFVLENSPIKSAIGTQCSF